MGQARLRAPICSLFSGLHRAPGAHLWKALGLWTVLAPLSPVPLLPPFMGSLVVPPQVREQIRVGPGQAVGREGSPRLCSPGPPARPSLLQTWSKAASLQPLCLAAGLWAPGLQAPSWQPALAPGVPSLSGLSSLQSSLAPAPLQLLQLSLVFPCSADVEVARL